jgi:D-beta-D-heptose 7-phosphate kinase/D-beta-D-heptose 1-phosphate adenosyltransferase
MIDLSAFGSKRVLVLGDAIVDEYLSGECSRLSPEAPVPVLRVSSARSVLGGAANTAANVASLGGHVTLVSLVGSDAGGEELARLAARSHIDLQAVDDGRPTLRKTRVVGQHQQLVRLDYEETHSIAPETEQRLLETVNRCLDDSHVVVISDYAKGLVTEAVCQAVVTAARAAGKPVVIDPRPQHRDFYRHCDYLTPNWKESQALLGLVDAPLTADNVRRTGESLARQLDANVLMTLGSSGMAFFGRDGEHFSVPTMAKEVFDVSGAGDTVVAAFSLARACGASHAEAVALANRAAGVVVGRFGTATVTAEDLAEAGQTSRRLIHRNELAGLSLSLRAQGKRVVTTNGSFDLLHAGHLHFLREASQLGDVLIVGLNSDASVRENKGPTRPVNPEAQRAEMLLALRFVDYVHIFDETVPMPFLEEIRPDVHVNGSEYGAHCIEARAVERYGGRVHVVNRLPGLATTNLLVKLGVERAERRDSDRHARSA